MRRGSLQAMAAMAMLVLAMGTGGCTLDRSLTTYVSGYEATSPEARERLAEFERQGRVTLVDDIESAKVVDYVVLAPLPRNQVRPAADEPAGEVLDRMDFFTMVDSHERAEQQAHARDIPVVNLQRFIEMVETGDVVRKKRGEGLISN